MAYGCRVYDGNGRDITGLFTPVFFLGQYSSSSGNVSFGDVPAGKSLKYSIIGIADWTGATTTPSVAVSGSSASWVGLNTNMSTILFYWG